MADTSKSSKAGKRALRLKQRKEEIQHDRAAAAKRRKTKKILNIFFIVAILAVLVIVVYSFVPKGHDTYDDFAQCLTEKGVVMFGTEWCHNCQTQKQLFGTSFEYIAYINCDANPTACENEGIRGYPTWVFADGEHLEGTQPLLALAQATECSLD